MRAALTLAQLALSALWQLVVERHALLILRAAAVALAVSAVVSMYASTSP